MSDHLNPQMNIGLELSGGSRERIYLLGENHQETNDLMNSLYNNGYQVRRFVHLPELCRACEKQEPLAVLYDQDSLRSDSSVGKIVDVFAQRQIKKHGSDVGRETAWFDLGWRRRRG